VSDSDRPRPPEARFVLAPPPPLRSLAISAVAAVVAAAVIVIATALDVPRAVVIAGIAIMIFAVVLAAVALVFTVRLRTTLIVDSKSITITTGRQRRVMTWSVIDSVKMRGPRLVLVSKPGAGPDVTVINPRESTDAAFSALVTEIGTRLDVDRGYKRLQ
jgi:hypothetical protein